MRIALLSDIHANLHAFRAVLGHMEAQGVDRFYSLGDTVGYNAFPSECTQLVREKAHVSVLGNHDWAATFGNTDGFNPVAKAAIEFTRRALREDDAKYLASLEPSARVLLPHVALELYHASPADPLREYVFPSTAPETFRRLLDAAPADRARIVVLGHTHVPMILSTHRLDRGTLGALPAVLAQANLEPERSGTVMLVNPGSVGQPRDGDARASYAVLDAESAAVTFHRVEYDVDAAARAVRDAGLPEILASRLALGR